MKRHRRLFAAVAFISVSVACTGGTQDPAPDPHDDHEETDLLTLSEEAYGASGVAVAPVESRLLKPTVRVTGTLSYDERKMAIATARIGGRITKVVADFGQRVAAGEPLAWIDSPELGAAQADFLRAASMKGVRKAEYDRALLLLEGQAISRGEMLRREADWRAAEADLQTAEQKLHILGLSQKDVEALSGNDSVAGQVYPVRAPVGGRVTEREAVPGRVVAPDDELFTVAELDSLWLFLQVFEKDLPSITEGASVTLRCESHPDDRFRGIVDFVGQVLDPHSRTVRARAVIDNPELDLKPGMFVYATIETLADDGARQPILAVPVGAATDIDGTSVVFVEEGERTFEIRPVVLGEVAGEWVEVRAGLAEGESIAISGVFTLKSEVKKGGLEGHEH